MHIQLLTFSGCPLAEPAKENLKQALAECEIETFEEFDILDPSSPADLRDWGSPTILINGEDATGASKGSSVCCRVYETPDRVPDIQSIIDCLRGQL